MNTVDCRTNPFNDPLKLARVAALPKVHIYELHDRVSNGALPTDDILGLVEFVLVLPVEAEYVAQECLAKSRIGMP